jgi:hypothetical protein
MISFETKKDILTKVNLMNKQEHAHIFLIFNRHKLPYDAGSEKTSICLKDIPDEVFIEIQTFIDMYEQRKMTECTRTDEIS